MRFEDFHAAFKKAASDRVAGALAEAGVRFKRRTDWRWVRWLRVEREYLIAVHPDDVTRAEEVFWQDAGPGRTFRATL